jgi:FkbM family methyltransferase
VADRRGVRYLSSHSINEVGVSLGPSKRIGFVVVSSDQGTFILNRFDYVSWGQNGQNVAGIGAYLLEGSSYDDDEAQAGCRILDLRRKHHGDGVIAVDCGANIGVFSVVWARHMAGWGQLVAIEPQERIYYALCGNIALNNCWNAQAVRAAVSDERGSIQFPEPDYMQFGSFGSLNLRDSSRVLQTLHAPKVISAQLMTIDSLQLPRLDFLKIDLEGMECEALRGAAETIRRFKPVISIEVMLDNDNLIEPLLQEFGYMPGPPEQNKRQLIVWHPDDPIRSDIASLNADPR